MRLFFALFLAVISLGCAANGQSLEGWNLTFSDDFNGTGKPDPERWISQEYNRRPNDKGPDGWWLKENVALDGKGHLVISLTEIPNRNDDKDRRDYATGMISTEGKFEQAFGRFEIRAKLPRERGWWAAFWLFGHGVQREVGAGEDGTEIDIMEGWGRSDKIQHALHWNGYGDAHKWVAEKNTIKNARKGFHVYALEWTPEEYIFFVDGAETWRSSAGGVSKVPTWIKITGEVSTEKWAQGRNWAGKLRRRKLPDTYVVDWVRVYEQEQSINNTLSK